MTVSPGKSQHLETRRKAAFSVLLVGPEGILLKGAVEKAGVEVRELKHAESILEAVLMADTGEDGAAASDENSGVILASVSQELDQLEQAVRSLRKVYPRWRIVLLCDASDEVICRKAKGWGANDYILLPADAESLREALSESPVTAEAPRPAPAELVREPVSVTAEQEPASKRIPAAKPVESVSRMAEAPEKCHAPVGATLLGLPLMVQTVLLNDLLAGRPDFTQRAVATLQSYVNLGGKLRFIAADQNTGALIESAGSENEIRCEVGLPQQPSFGMLALEIKDDAQAVSATVMLSQAAQWLGAMLALARRYEQLRSLAITDELSGAYNRRYFMKWMTGLLERARAKRFRVTLMMFDIDDFKRYNDTFGHASGDAIIRELIKLLRGCSRSHDLVARLGGDEFAVVYWDNEAPRQPNSEHPKDVLVATERFRKAIQEHHWADSCKIKGEVSISGGLATFPWDADTLETLMEKADEALLRAKAAGKNAIVMHGKGGEAGCGEGE